MLYLEGSPTLNIRVVWKLTYSFTDDGKSEFAGGIQLRRSNREVNHGNKGKSGRNVLVCTFFN